MDANIHRDAVISAYPSKKWRDRVAKMSDNQVIAIWFRLRRQGRII